MWTYRKYKQSILPELYGIPPLSIYQRSASFAKFCCGVATPNIDSERYTRIPFFTEMNRKGYSNPYKKWTPEQACIFRKLNQKNIA